MVNPLGEYGLSPGRGEPTAENGAEVLRLALILDPDQAKLLNNLAWALVSVPDSPPHDPAQALEAIRKAVSLEPDKWCLWNTLGVAAYRAGDWKDGRRGPREVHEPESSHEGGEAADWFFLAMTRWRQGSRPRRGSCSTGPWNGPRRTSRGTRSSSGSRPRPRRCWGSPRSPPASKPAAKR